MYLRKSAARSDDSKFKGSVDLITLNMYLSKADLQRRLASFALVFLIAIAVFAHDTWLAARVPSVRASGFIQLDLTSGMVFPELETAIKPERIELSRYRLNGAEGNLDPVAAPKSLMFRAQLKTAGLAAFWVQLKPRALELTPEQVDHYLDEINAPSSVRDAWKNAGEKRRWRETYIKHAKTYVVVGVAKTDDSWSRPVGLGLEIVPDKNPGMLRAGDDFPVRVLKQGSPLVNFSVSMICANDKSGIFQQTDSEGRASFRLPRSEKCLLRGTELRQSTKPDSDWESDFTTLVISVR